MPRRRHTTHVELPAKQEPAEAAALLAEFICKAPNMGETEDGNSPKPKTSPPTAKELGKPYRWKSLQEDPPASISVAAIGESAPMLWRLTTQITTQQGSPPLSASITVTNHEPKRRGVVIFTADASPAFPEERWSAIIEAAQEALDIVSDDAQPRDVTAPTAEIQNLGELMADHQFLVVVNNEAEEPDPERIKTAQQMAKYATLGPATQMRLLRNMDLYQSSEWLKSDWLWLSREIHDPDSVHVRALPHDLAAAMQVAKEEIENLSDSTEFGTIRTLQRALDQLAENTSELTERAPRAEQDDHLAQQRINTLDDLIKEREKTIRQQQATIQRMNLELDATRAAPVHEEATAEPADAEGLDTVIMRNANRWPHLVIMESLIESAASKHPSLPTGDEMVRVLDNMEKLGEALAQSEDEKVGTFSSHFEQLSGWSYSRGESKTTMQRFGEQRWFNDENGRRFCQRHLTRRNREHATQIYFDKEPGVGLAVAYVGPHLPIVSRP